MVARHATVNGDVDINVVEVTAAAVGGDSVAVSAGGCDGGRCYAMTVSLASVALRKGK